MPGPGLYANIHAKRKRGGKMRKKGDKGAPKASDFAAAKRTAKDKGGPVKKKEGLGKPPKSLPSNNMKNLKKFFKKTLSKPKPGSPDNPIEVKKGGRIKKKMKRGGRAK